MGQFRRMLKVLIHRELLDLSRDRKTIVTVIILPIALFPTMGIVIGVMYMQQPVCIAVLDLDGETYTDVLSNITVSSRWLVENITTLEKYGYSVTLVNDEDALRNPTFDVVVVINRGFSRNASSFDKVALVKVYRRAFFQSAIQAEFYVNNVVYFFSSRLSEAKISRLADMTNVTLNPTALKNPVLTRTEVVTLAGEVAQKELELKSMMARLLIIALSMVVTPASSYIIDGLIGERERKTIEFLLVAPVSVGYVIYSKMVVASLLGLVVAVLDAIGILLYFTMVAYVLGGSWLLLLDLNLLAAHSVTAFFTILVTITVSLPFITRTRGIRSASNIAGIVTSMATIIFLSGFFVDYYRLPPAIQYPLYLIPFIHSVLAIQTYILNQCLRTIIHLTVLASLSLILLFVTIKTIDSEKILMPSS